MTAALSFVLMCYARMGSMNRADMVITPDSPAVRALPREEARRFQRICTDQVEYRSAMSD